ncbi:MAG TPA: helix-turn-helix domain-containing protein [Parvibaculum sp.]|jgi:AcrR family transcriptional regulator
MPKIVDHNRYRTEIAEKAVAVFRKHGFNGVGMRQIAEDTGLSKSALYHYFPSKQALFAACTERVTGVGLDATAARKPAAPARPKAQAKALREIAETLEGDFRRDLPLLLDYLRGRTTKQVARDPNMRLANHRYRRVVADLVGAENATPVLCLVMGTLLQRLLDGNSTDFAEIETWLGARLDGRKTRQRRTV